MVGPFVWKRHLKHSSELPSNSSLECNRPLSSTPIVVSPLVDFLFRLKRPDRVADRAAVLCALDRFPALATLSRHAVLRSYALNDAADRIIYRLLTSVPGCGKAIARFIPLTGSLVEVREIPKDRPIIINLLHFGQSHLVCSGLVRLFYGRKLYAVHAGGYTAPAVANYLRSIGIQPVANDQNVLLKLTRLMTENPACAVVFAFDYRIGQEKATRERSLFLGRSIPMPRNLAYVADRANALVVTALGRTMLKKPHIIVLPPLEIDLSKPAKVRQAALTEDLLSQLETCLWAAPGEWAEWLRTISG